MKKVSIRERLILYFVMLSVISITVVSLFSIFEAKKGITDRTFNQLILLRDLRREQILEFFNFRSAELRSLAISAEMIEMADTNIYKTVYFLSAAGLTYQSTDSGKVPGFPTINDLIRPGSSILEEFNKNSEIPGYLVFEQLNSQESDQIYIAVPVTVSGGKSIGAVVAEIKPAAVYNIIYDEVPGSGMGMTGEAYLAGPDGLMRSPSRFIPGAVMKIHLDTEGFHEAVAGKEGVGIYKDYRGIEILGAYGSLSIGGLKRIILAEIDVNEAMVPLKAIRNEILLVSMVILLAIFSITWFLAYGITRPLVRLKNAAQLISGGNYTQQLEIGVDDEIGELTRAFNTMVREINIITHDLRENEERLRHFYRATLDGIILHFDDRMLLFNSAMLYLTGYTESELNGYRVSDILQLKKGADCDKDTEARTFESILIRKDGSGLPVEIQESCVD